MIENARPLQGSPSRRDPIAVRLVLILLTFGIFIVLLILPLLVVVFEGLKKGLDFYLASIADPVAQSAIALTLSVTAWVLPLNTLFGICAAWAITKRNYRLKTLLSTTIDLPFAISPVIAGLIFVLLVGARSPLGAWLVDHGIRVIFSTPGIIIATIFVTFPFVARELIPLMEAQGREEEEAALTLGASGWQMFFRISLPNIKWGIIYGMILCNARAIGEFGAVSVVSGHIRGLTNTIPLHVEILYNEYNFVGSFAVASVLVVLALITLCLKLIVEWRFRKEKERA